jgi:hypothetical protein|tara:strand:+ start:2234 stop:2749 length:516 start_codon:yes stop_codon:yes gene_type:complete
MANQIRIHTSVEVINDGSEENVGSAAGDYTNLNMDVHANSRSWGGNYNIATDKHADGAYNDDDICYWANAVVDITSAGGGLGDSVWNEGNVAPTGNIPAVAHVLAVEYVKELGTATVTVQINSEVHALLVGGDAIVIPLHAGEAVANIEIFSAEYSSGTHEATVNVMIAGV